MLVYEIHGHASVGMLMIHMAQLTIATKLAKEMARKYVVEIRQYNFTILVRTLLVIHGIDIAI